MNRALKFDESIILSPESILLVFSDLSLQSLIVLVANLSHVNTGHSYSLLNWRYWLLVKIIPTKVFKIKSDYWPWSDVRSRGLIELIKSIAKLMVIVSVITTIIYSVCDRVFFLNLLSPKMAVESGLDILTLGILLVTLTLLCIAAIVCLTK